MPPANQIHALLIQTATTMGFLTPVKLREVARKIAMTTVFRMNVSWVPTVISMVFQIGAILGTAHHRTVTTMVNRMNVIQIVMTMDFQMPVKRIAIRMVSPMTVKISLIATAMEFLILVSLSLIAMKMVCPIDVNS